jgi:hypothetical protein
MAGAGMANESGAPSADRSQADQQIFFLTPRGRLSFYQEILLHGKDVYSPTGAGWLVAASFHSNSFVRAGAESYASEQARPELMTALLKGRIIQKWEASDALTGVVLSCGKMDFYGRVKNGRDLRLGEFVEIPDEGNVIEAELVDVLFPKQMEQYYDSYRRDEAMYAKNVWFKALVSDVRTTEESIREGSMVLELCNGQKIRLARGGLKKDLIGKSVLAKAATGWQGGYGGRKLDTPEYSIIPDEQNSPENWRAVLKGRLFSDNTGLVYVDCGAATFFVSNFGSMPMQNRNFKPGDFVSIDSSEINGTRVSPRLDLIGITVVERHAE